MYLKHGLVALLALGPVSAAWAVPATDDGAARLKGIFQTYLGGVDGVVTVTPKGETYDLVIDPTPLLAQISSESDVKFEVGTLTYHLTDKGDGSWGVTENQTLSWSFTIPNMMEQIGSAKIESTGIWDEALPGFREQTGVMTGYTVNTTQYLPVTPAPGAAGEPAPEAELEYEVMSRDTQSIDRAETVLKASPAAAGGVDHDMTYSAQGVYQTVEYTAVSPFGAMKFDITSPGYDGKATIKGSRNDGMLGLLAWFVAHPSQELIANSQDGLRDKLSAAMPLWDDVAVDMNLRDLKVVSPFGEFTASNVGAEIGLSGVEADGRFREMVRITGLKIPEAIVPPWALPVIPQEVSFDFTASQFDLAAPVKMIIEGFDLTAADPIAKVDPVQLKAAFFAGSPIALELAPSQIKGEGYQIDYQGQMQLPADTPPGGTARISASGLDKIEAALNAAPPEQAQQPLMMLQMAKMLSKPGASGEMVWEIDASTPGGPISVNGQQVGGGPAPQQ
ncbi:hypothetical protein [Paracoccus lutimaris]|uniref:DUF2125 domain-containing protein n=1 Tax=Paracoccus lutimaris TaxID=1490030 RepID=A0A368YNB3_9RHOB|nr:hypothetical protein [Paracoccus lutimaris]RCW81028.1 hypothetical protein DFP89_11632 [Paracoccus lutimaris]